MQEVPPAEGSQPGPREFLARDVGWPLGTVFTLALLIALMFGYDQILNNGNAETAVQTAVARQWLEFRSR